MSPLGARAHLDGGFAYEQGGATAKAAAAYEAAVAAAGAPRERAEAHLRLARVHRTRCEWDDAVRESRTALGLADAAGDDDLAAEAMNVEVGVHQLRGAYDAGEALALQALARARTPRVRGITQQNRGSMAALQADFDRAEELFAASVAAFEEAGYELGMAVALNNAAAAARDRGEHGRALELGARAAAAARRVDAMEVLMLALQNQAHALVRLGRHGEAEALLGEALGQFSMARNVVRQAECVEVLGLAYALQPGEASRETASRCYALAESLATRAGAAALAERVRDRRAALRETA